jgi:hypothetical protein
VRSVLSLVPYPKCVHFASLTLVVKSYGSELRLLAEVGSGDATCPMAPDLASRLRWAPTLPRVLWLRTSPPG